MINSNEVNNSTIDLFGLVNKAYTGKLTIILTIIVSLFVGYIIESRRDNPISYTINVAPNKSMEFSLTQDDYLVLKKFGFSELNENGSISLKPEKFTQYMVDLIVKPNLLNSVKKKFDVKDNISVSYMPVFESDGAYKVTFNAFNLDHKIMYNVSKTVISDAYNNMMEAFYVAIEYNITEIKEKIKLEDDLVQRKFLNEKFQILTEIKKERFKLDNQINTRIKKLELNYTIAKNLGFVEPQSEYLIINENTSSLPFSADVEDSNDEGQDLNISFGEKHREIDYFYGTKIIQEEIASAKSSFEINSPMMNSLNSQLMTISSTPIEDKIKYR